MDYQEIFLEGGKWLLVSVVLGGIAYELLFRKLWKFIRAYVKSIGVTRKILKSNRPTRNAGGKYTADRLLDLWNNGDPMPLVSRKGTIYKAAGRWPSVHWENVIDEILVKEGLVVRYEEEGRWQAKFSNSLLQKFVLKRLLKMVEKGEL